MRCPWSPALVISLLLFRTVGCQPANTWSPALIISLLLLITRGPLCAQPIPEPHDPGTLLSLTDKTIDIIYADGHRDAYLTVAETTEGKTPEAVKLLSVTPRDSQRSIKINGAKIAEIILEDQPLDIVYDRKQRGLVFSPEKRIDRLSHEKEVRERLDGINHRIWPPLSDQEHEKLIESQREFLKSVEQQMPRLNFRYVETEYFLFFTDLTPDQVDGYIVSLDAMYRELCLAFGLSPQRNIWAGKCVVIAFQNKLDYLSFEAQIMGNSDALGTQGLCHQFGNGEVKFAGYRDDGSFFGQILVHETTHGFIHRYYSSARAPSWLDEGMADWVTKAIFPDDKIPRRQRESAKLVMQRGSWSDDFLTTDQISGEYYGSASALVDILLANDKGGQFRAFFHGIKEGKATEESLKEVFGISYQDLKIAYAQAAMKLAR